MPQTVDILAVGAHPDDVELTCAGTLLHHKNLGYSIGIVDLTAGELGTRGNAQTRAEEARISAEILGLKHRINLALPDGFFSEDEHSLRKLIGAIRTLKPKVVLANAVADRHPDHGRGGSFISRACFLAGLLKIETTDTDGKLQLPHRPQAVYHYIQDRYLIPDLVVDITPWFDTKMASVKAYGTQFFSGDNHGPETPISSPDFLYFIESRARDFGRLIGVRYGEGFTVERAVGINDLTQLI